ncbi:GNAT family N-acetyltransferase [Streptomyces sp. V3I7]|uniref:GNAT family N-acetyltransferase n=1 Tax=Streptomyces sp. V3I7 TaxID=3042278 RepID=UPI002780FDE5|nr:GNAT family N-acetyltransferase [Streptomyces sp. V3I7]MDQ0993924.1 GNAT superfamily N-acetyltransferase [Streptomyces sp. V3I7]
MNDAPVHIRAMTPADCDRVAEIRVAGWRSAYRGLMPQTYLDALDVAADAERRRSWFRDSRGDVVNLVAERDGALVGWAAHGPYRDGEVRTADAELYALYVDRAHLGGGVGRALLERAVREASAAGRARMFLWVLQGNTRARRFYERAGFGADGAEEPFEVDGVAVPEVRYVREPVR